MTNPPEHAPAGKPAEDMAAETSASQPIDQPANKPDFELLFSNLNLPPRIAAFGNLQRHADILGALRGDEPEMLFAGGYEVTPTRRLGREMLRQGVAVHELTSPHRFASAVHQPWAPSFRRGLMQSKGSPRQLAFEWGAAATMWESNGSLAWMAQLAQRLDDVPAVVYADQRRHGKLLEYRRWFGFAQAETQVHPELVQAYGPEASFRDVCASLGKRGIAGLVIDPHHIMRADKSGTRLDPDKIMADIRATETPVLRIHAAAGRVDASDPEDVRRSMQELRALRHSPEAIGRTALGDMMLAAHSIWHNQGESWPGAKLPVTIEVPYKGLHESWGGNRLPLNVFVALHRTIAHNVYQFMDQADASNRARG